VLKVDITLTILPCSAFKHPLPILLVILPPQSCPLRYVPCEMDGSSIAADNKMLNLIVQMLCCVVLCAVLCALLCCMLRCAVLCCVLPYVLCAALSSTTPSLLSLSL
jgi:hypothetical protein